MAHISNKKFLLLKEELQEDADEVFWWLVGLTCWLDPKFVASKIYTRKQYAQW